MVASSDPHEVLGSTRGKENFVRLSRLLVGGGAAIVREVFDRLCPPDKLASVLSDKETKDKLRAQRFRYIQWDYLYPPSGGCGKSKEFNLNLLLKLLRKKEFCNVKFPVKGYKLPTILDLSYEADLARINYYYHSVFENVKVNMEITDDEFPSLWKEISGALLRLVEQHFKLENQCAWKEAIDNLLKSYLTEGKVPPQEMEDFDLKPAEESTDEEHAASEELTDDSTDSDGNSLSLIAGKYRIFTKRLLFTDDARTFTSDENRLKADGTKFDFAVCRKRQGKRRCYDLALASSADFFHVDGCTRVPFRNNFSDNLIKVNENRTQS